MDLLNVGKETNLYDILNSSENNTNGEIPEHVKELATRVTSALSEYASEVNGVYRQLYRQITTLIGRVIVSKRYGKRGEVIIYIMNNIKALEESTNNEADVFNNRMQVMVCLKEYVLPTLNKI